jgi:hypothetical protein
MALLLMLLLAGPALAQPADCPAIPVGPPVNIGIRADLGGQANSDRTGCGHAKSGKTGRVTVGVQLPGVPVFGTICAPPPPPPDQDSLHGPPAPAGLLRDDDTRDVLTGRRLAPPPAPLPPPLGPP